MANDYGNPFSVCFNIMKIRYSEYDKSIDAMNFITPNDKVNIFINLESVLSNLSCLKDIDKKLILERNFSLILVSEFLNLCAHYKRFFRGNNLKTRVFLYSTDLSSDDYSLYKWNDEYRSYYTVKFMNNPRYGILGNAMVESVYNEIRTISEFINNVYFINAKNIEGSMIPYIIWKKDQSWKNFIITEDIYDTQYQLLPNFCVHYIKKSPLGTVILDSFRKTICDIFKISPDSSEASSLSVFYNASMYALLLSVLGNKKRSIDSVKSIGAKSVLKYIISGINDGIITSDTNVIELLSEIFPKEFKEIVTNNFMCIDIRSQYENITDKELFSIESQIIDRFDNNSLITLNNTRYSNYQLMLPELTC